MAPRDAPTVADLFLAAPAKSSLLTLGPLALAFGQLANSYVTGFSPLIAVGFAIVMVAFAVVATGHHAAELRLQRLERTVHVSDERR